MSSQLQAAESVQMDLAALKEEEEADGEDDGVPMWYCFEVSPSEGQLREKTSRHDQS